MEKYVLTHAAVREINRTQTSQEIIFSRIMTVALVCSQGTKYHKLKLSKITEQIPQEQNRIPKGNIVEKNRNSTQGDPPADRA